LEKVCFWTVFWFEMVLSNEVVVMKSIRVSEDIVSIREFNRQSAYWLERISETEQPVVITQNGKPAGVLLSPSGFDGLQERQRFLESIASGFADADAGRLMDKRELKRRLALERRAPAGE
jgi:prevent-host-death family protein